MNNKTEFYEGAVLTREQLRSSREFSAPHTAIVTTGVVGGLLGTLFLGLFLWLITRGNSEDDTVGVLFLILALIVGLIAWVVIYCCRATEKEILQEAEAYRVYETGVVTPELSVERYRTRYYTATNLVLIGTTDFHIEDGTQVLKEVKHTLRGDSFTPEDFALKRIYVAYNAKTDKLLTFREEMKKLDTDETSYS